MKSNEAKECRARSEDLTIGAELRNRARFAPLTGYPTTSVACELAEALLAKHMSALAPNAARDRHRTGVGALLAELLCADEGYWLFRSDKSTGHTGAPVGQRIYTQVRETFVALGLVEYVRGVNHWLPEAFEKTEGYRYEGPSQGGDGRVSKRWAARWRATPALIEQAAAHGITREHFTFQRQLPKDPLVARTANWRDEYGQKIAGRAIKIRHTEHTKRLEREVRELNEYLDKYELEGGKHEGFRRIFQKGDDPAFDWNMGRRLYSLPPGEENYQQLHRDKRLKMIINGEPVAELDIRACFLTLLHAWHGVPLDATRDPYDLPGLGARGRDSVKLWFVATFGKLTPVEHRWPHGVLTTYEKRSGKKFDRKRYPVAVVREKALAAYPVLRHWGTPDASGRVRDWSDLMFAESEIVIAAMRDLMISHDVPSYPVHDSLIVPAEHAELAHSVLVAQFKQITGQLPFIAIKSHGAP